MALLEIVNLTKRFGGLLAVADVSFTVDDREILSLIGPNGAGKTTAFNCVTGLFPISAGDIRLDGASIAGLAPHRITTMGIARTFQNIRLFSFMTALDNVMVGAHWWMKERVWDGALRTRRARSEERSVQELAYDLLDQLGIARYAGSYARELPYGLQRRLEIARALATHPRLLLLDEPAAGLNPQEKKELMALISRLRDEGPHHLPHRARHEGGHGGERPHRGARPRREDHRGPPCRRFATTRR